VDELSAMHSAAGDAAARAFTPAGGRVTVMTERDRGGWVSTVSDTGIGIPDDQETRSFERFFRSIDIESSSRGTTVTVWVPEDTSLDVAEA
jgi:signal transduction histidine kinase